MQTTEKKMSFKTGSSPTHFYSVTQFSGQGICPSGVQNSLCLTSSGEQEPTYLRHHLMPPRVLTGRKLDQKQRGDSNLSTYIWDVGIPGGDLTTVLQSQEMSSTTIFQKVHGKSNWKTNVSKQNKQKNTANIYSRPKQIVKQRKGINIWNPSQQENQFNCERLSCI